jgi:ATP-binding cassette, subfamily B, bacterial PglK
LNNPKIITLIKKLWQYINKSRKGEFYLLFSLMITTSLVEVISISAVLPFIIALTNPSKLYENEFSAQIIKYIGIKESSEIAFPLTIIFALAAFFSGIMRLFLLKMNTRLSFEIGADLGIDIYKKTLNQPYAVHCSRNSSEIIAGISVKVNTVIVSIIFPIMNLLSSSLMFLLIIGTLFYIDVLITLSAVIGFGIIYLIIIKFTKKKALINSHSIAKESVQVIKTLQEGLGGIRDVLINGSQETYCQVFKESDYKLRTAQGNNVFIGASPRYGVETLGMVLIAALAYFQTKQNNDIGSAIPMLGVLALGAQRLLPALQQIYAAWISINSNLVTLSDVIELLKQPLPSEVKKTNKNIINFDKVIKLENLGFKYKEEGVSIISKIDLEIKKGSRTGIIGATGSGKSTLMDIIMGLLEPTIGSISIDGVRITPENQRDWQLHIAHVPQMIYLTDSTIEENIAFGVPKELIEPNKVREAAKQAQLDEYIEGLTLKYQAKVGENGVFLSGGQRQRIGIARALYKKTKVIIFDEATSALDNETEEAVMKSIEELSNDVTIIIIAHRISTIKKCTQIIKLENGNIEKIKNID